MNSFVCRNERLRRIQNDITELQLLIGEPVDSFCEVVDPELAEDERLDVDFNCDEIDPDFLSSQESGESDSNGRILLRGESTQRMFKEALSQMMGGVLEVSWEEEIKKNPLKPLCLIDFVPESEFTDQDRREARAYEEEMAKLTKDRKIYIEKLLVERSQLIETLEVQTIHLNKCIQNVLQSKIHTEFAVGSEKLCILIASVDHLRYKQIEEEENRVQ